MSDVICGYLVPDGERELQVKTPLVGWLTSECKYMCGMTYVSITALNSTLKRELVAQERCTDVIVLVQKREIHAYTDREF